MSTEVDELVAKASRSNSQTDSDNLYQALLGKEVFFPLSTDGSDQGEKSVPLLSLPSGQHAYTLYTSKKNKQLPVPFGGALWEHALEILVKMPQADGLLIHNDLGNTVAVSKQHAHLLLQKLGVAVEVRRRK